MKNTNQVDLQNNANSIITVDAEPLPTTSELAEFTPKNNESAITLNPVTSSLEATLAHYSNLIEFCKNVLQQQVDWGTVPGCNKPVLFKPGAEKLCKLFNLYPRFELYKSIEDWTGKDHGLNEPLFHYHYKCSLYHNGELICQGEGNCNSLEKKYRFDKYGKPNPRIYDCVNTIAKMAMKRSLLSAVLVATGASELFTQDMEDFAERVNAESEQKPQSKNESSELGKQELIEQSTGILEQLGWSKLVASKFAEKVVGKKVRAEMTTSELSKLIAGMLAELEKIQNQQKAAS